jgi:hypothetical protein
MSLSSSNSNNPNQKNTGQQNQYLMSNQTNPPNFQQRINQSPSGQPGIPQLAQPYNQPGQFGNNFIGSHPMMPGTSPNMYNNQFNGIFPQNMPNYNNQYQYQYQQQQQQQQLQQQQQQQQQQQWQRPNYQGRTQRVSHNRKNSSEKLETSEINTKIFQSEKSTIQQLISDEINTKIIQSEKSTVQQLTSEEIHTKQLTFDHLTSSIKNVKVSTETQSPHLVQLDSSSGIIEFNLPNSDKSTILLQTCFKNPYQNSNYLLLVTPELKDPIINDTGTETNDNSEVIVPQLCIYDKTASGFKVKLQYSEHKSHLTTMLNYISIGNQHLSTSPVDLSTSPVDRLPNTTKSPVVDNKKTKDNRDSE